MIVKLRLKDIFIPQGLLPRIFGVNDEKVEEYAEAIQHGAVFPPIKVWEKQDGTYQIIDGVHRISAYRKLGKEYIEAEIVKDIKDETDFMIWAISENLKHGLPLSREDKREDARRLYIKGIKPEDIAILFKVSLRTVYNWIGDLKDQEKLEREKLKQKALELREKGYTQEQIAEELGLEQGTISKWLSNYSILKNFKTEYLKNETFENPPNEQSPDLNLEEMTEDEKFNKAWELHNQGHSVEEVAEMLKVPYEIMYGWLWKDWGETNEEGEEEQQKEENKVEIVPLKAKPQKKEKEHEDPDEVYKKLEYWVEHYLALIIGKFSEEDVLELIHRIEQDIATGRYKNWEGWIINKIERRIK